jgi:hypothetical protein
MKPIPSLAFTAVSLSALLFIGCATTSSGPEKGPDGTIAYHVQIESSEPGARVEANGDYVGNTPTTLKIFGDKDGTFHNFGSSDFIIQVTPQNTNHFPQTRVFRTGGWFSQEDQIPKRLFFDTTKKSEGFTIERSRY